MKYNPATDKWLMSIDTRLVEYDEYQDDYTELATIPEDDSIDEAPPGGYGEYLADESLTLTGQALSSEHFAIHDDFVYVTVNRLSANIHAFNRETGAYDGSRSIAAGFNIRIGGIKIYNNILYASHFNSGSGNFRLYNLETRALIRTFNISLSGYSASRFSVTPDYIYFWHDTDNAIKATDHDGNVESSINITLPTNLNIPGLGTKSWSNDRASKSGIGFTFIYT